MRPFPWLILMALSSVGCERATVPDAGPRAGEEQMASYIALGDSYTIGEGVDPEERWPVQFAGALGYAPPKIVARTGWTVRELEAAIEAQTSPADEYAVVTLLIGVNDEFRGGDPETYRVDFDRVLTRALKFGADDTTRVTVVSIPDYGVTPFGAQREGVSARIDAFNAVAEQITIDRGMRWVDVTGISRQMPDAVVSDGLHPNGAQYAAWARAIEQP